MTPELTYLAYSIILLFVIVFIQASAGIRQHGGLVLANNRDNLPSANTFVARAKRNVDNMRENLWFFAPAALIVAITDASTSWTILGAQIFFFARVAHAITYLAGWPFIRPLFWFAGIIGCALIFLSLFGILV
ncbi:MAG: MAPEG family protein [Hyphomonadaceae bacterium]|nr:MAPEG family protein [Caulobacteraceae bacterium]MBP6689421.1 MAPEG family protein [Hyphomonadaceae bacterium]